MVKVDNAGRTLLIFLDFFEHTKCGRKLGGRRTSRTRHMWNGRALRERLV